MASPLDSHTRMANALNQIQNKKPPPEIDFTIHKLEDGNTISTQERVIKEVHAHLHLCIILIISCGLCTPVFLVRSLPIKRIRAVRLE